ncbi:MAG TPA: S8 family serine peptidase [Armatimonadota bacterium]|nr:S8 family serine peptidase [Armatimonadota bacterium]
MSICQRSNLITSILLLLFAFAGEAAFGLPGESHPRLDPALSMLASAPAHERASFAYRFKILAAPEGDELGVILQYTGDLTKLRAAGARIRTRLGSILTATIPVDKLNAVASLPGVKYIQPAKRFELLLDVSVPETGAAGLRSGTPPSWEGYTGKGVVVGFVDTGIDCTHWDFKNPDGTTRIVSIWDQSTGTGGANHPPPYDYGTEWTKAQIDAGQCTEKDTSSHGTGVAGVAAGNGSATGYGWPAYRYVGMAPEADIIMVKCAFYDDEIVDGINYIKNKAAALGKPCAINLSIGSQYGAHDGTDIVELAIDQISGSGVVVCTATGNNGTTDPTRYIHAEWTTPVKDSSVTAGINVLSNRSNPFYMDLWYEGNDSIDMTVTTPNGYSVTIQTGYTTGGYCATLDGNIWLDNSPGGTNPYNGDHECLIAIQNALSGAWSITATARTIKAGGFCDAWILGGQNVFWSSYANNSKSCTIPATCISGITVSGYVTKSWWHNPDGTLQGWPSTYGSFYTASGEGPTRDGRQKPDLAVPTTRIATAKSADSTPSPTDIVEDGVHMVMTGTSMAAPHMTGAAALALQKDPTATAAEIKERVMSTARADSLTGPVPNMKWGNGKLDLEAAMGLVPLYTNVAGARAQPEGALVKLPDQLVSAGISQMGDRFYIESPDRSCGIQVRRASGDQPAERDKVTVVGGMGLADGERGILDSSITRTATGCTLPDPVCMTNRDFGGADVGSLIPGITGGCGLNSIGLLVKTWGKVTYIGSDHFYIDDGSGVQGAGHVGIKIRCPGLTKPSPTQYVVAAGICSLELDGSIRYPVLRVRKQADLVYY